MTTNRPQVTAHRNQQMGGVILTGALTGRFATMADAEAAILNLDPCAAVVATTADRMAD